MCSPTVVRRRACVCVFPFFFSYLVLSAFIVAHLFCTRTSSSNPYPKSNFGSTEPGSEPGSRAEIPLRRDNRRYVAFFWYASPRQKIFKPPFDSIRVHVLCIVYVIYLHREEIPRYILLNPWDWNAVNVHHWSRTSFDTTRESALDGGTCELVSITLLLVRCRPDIISIQTSPTLFTSMLSF